MHLHPIAFLRKSTFTVVLHVLLHFKRSAKQPEIKIRFLLNIHTVKDGYKGMKQIPSRDMKYARTELY